MSNRNIEIKVRLNRKEMEVLDKRVKKSRLSREGYLRHLINGSIPREAPPPDYYDKLLDEMLGAPIQKEEPTNPNPSAAKMEKSPPSEPTSKKPSRTAEGTAKKADDRPSVREELREIKAARQETAEKPAAPSKEQPGKKPQQKTTQHKQPGNKKKKHKSKAR